MESYLSTAHYDLITPDGVLTHYEVVSPNKALGNVLITNISPAFVGFEIEKELLSFNLKSVLAQLGIEARETEIELCPKSCSAELKITFQAFGHIARLILPLLTKGTLVGKIFASDERRRVRSPEYLFRMFNRCDRHDNPLLSLGGLQGSQQLILEKIEGRAIAFITLLEGTVEYEPSIEGLLPTVIKALKDTEALSARQWIHLHQNINPKNPRCVEPNEILLVKTPPLHVRTVFAKIVDEFLPSGISHTRANILQPDTQASGDIYEIYGDNPIELIDIPLEFYTLEPHREHVFFADRDQLQTCLENSESLLKAFETAPEPKDHRAAIFIVKGEQLLNLKSTDWIVRNPNKHDFQGLGLESRQSLMVEQYITQQPSYPFLKAIEDNLITSQGILLTRFFPTPMMKRLLINTLVQQQLKGIYFQIPSQSFDSFFSQEDRSLLNDLTKFGIPVFWVDEKTKQVLKYVQRPEKDIGMFVPLNLINHFLKATMFGVYGSNLLEGEFEEELHTLLQGLLQIKKEFTHSLLNNEIPIGLITGGGPGAMEVGNRVAKKLGILSCANLVDFRDKESLSINEQLQNPHIDIKMTYRLDKLVERQAEFGLDFPIFLTGGIGTDFELLLEEVNRKVGAISPTPILLFGNEEYWKEKITHRFQCNLKQGTIKGSQWLSNCFYCIQNAQEGLEVYKRFFTNTLPIGPKAPANDKGFVSVKKDLLQK
jgi:predicted Rossmann-fold nucleotide-binding protein